MIKYGVYIAAKGGDVLREVVAAPDVVKALFYGLNKYGQYGRVHVSRYYGPEAISTIL